MDPRTMTIEDLQAQLEDHHYACDRAIATAVYLAIRLGKPLLVEGEAGVGKTELAKVVAHVLKARLIRLQCYEGLDATHALYEWNYPKQILRIKLGELDAAGAEAIGAEIYTEPYLIRRPLLEAIRHDDPVPPVLLIDEIDRGDTEFEAFLLEVLSDFQVTIPELGTLRADRRPHVFLTSNRTREIHDALKRRCLYHWIDYPTPEKEHAIIATRVPEASDGLARQICAFMQRIRAMNLSKRPGVAETLDWAQALVALSRRELDPGTVEETLGCIFKYREDIEHFQEEVAARRLNLDEVLRLP